MQFLLYFHCSLRFCRSSFELLESRNNAADEKPAADENVIEAEEINESNSDEESNEKEEWNKFFKIIEEKTYDEVEVKQILYFWSSKK